MDTGDFIILLLILLIMFLTLTKGLFYFDYDMDKAYLTDFIKTFWDLDFKYFFRSTENKNIFMTKTLGDEILRDTFNI